MNPKQQKQVANMTAILIRSFSDAMHALVTLVCVALVASLQPCGKSRLAEALLYKPTYGDVGRRHGQRICMAAKSAVALSLIAVFARAMVGAAKHGVAMIRYIPCINMHNGNARTLFKKKRCMS